MASNSRRRSDSDPNGFLAHVFSFTSAAVGAVPQLDSLGVHAQMKRCGYCGRENEDAAVFCHNCGTAEFKTDTFAESVAPSPPPLPQLASTPTAPKSALEFKPLKPEDRDKDLVTLLTCRTLVDADLIVSQLESADIAAFIPDQFLMQSVSWNLNTFGFVRVQVSPKDYEAAKEFLSAPD